MRCGRCPFSLACLQTGKPPGYVAQCYACNRTIVEPPRKWTHKKGAVLQTPVPRLVRIVTGKKNKAPTVVTLSEYYWVLCCQPVKERTPVEERSTGRLVAWKLHAWKLHGLDALDVGMDRGTGNMVCPICENPKYAFKSLTRVLTEHRILVIDLDAHPSAVTDNVAEVVFREVTPRSDGT